MLESTVLESTGAGVHWCWSPLVLESLWIVQAEASRPEWVGMHQLLVANTLLDPWTAGVLVCWSAGVFVCWCAAACSSAGDTCLVCWYAGVLICWYADMLVYWSMLFLRILVYHKFLVADSCN